MFCFSVLITLLQISLVFYILFISVFQNMQDKNYESYWGQSNLIIDNRAIWPPDSNEYSDILKFSICSNVLVDNCEIVGGREDAIDCVRGEDYKFSYLKLHPKGKNGITIKGSIKNTTISNVIFMSHGKECDIELGQHCIYDSFWGSDKTEGITLINVHSNDSVPVKIKVWNATKPTIIGGNVQVKMVPTIFVKLYFAFRWLQIHLFKK